jgi:hypothetical protein
MHFQGGVKHQELYHTERKKISAVKARVHEIVFQDLLLIRRHGQPTKRPRISSVGRVSDGRGALLKMPRRSTTYSMYEPKFTMGDEHCLKQKGIARIPTTMMLMD